MLKAIFELLVLYLLYKFIFDFIIPMYQTTKQVRQKVNKMQEDINAHIQRQQNNYNSNANTSNPGNTSNTAKKDDYIDFEEVK